MFKNYLITTIRKLNRQKNYTAINVLSLALGMTCCIFIFLIIRYELKFDDFHDDVEHIYRIVTDERMNDAISHTMGSPLPLAPALRGDFPELAKVTATFGMTGGLFAITRKDLTVKRFQENDRVAYLEPEFFEMFHFPWIAGDPKSLAEPNCVALTESIAKKFFEGENAVGKTIRLDNELDLKVTGVVKDFPVHTDFAFDIMISWETVTHIGMPLEEWRNLSSNVNTYVLLPSNYSPQQLLSELPDFKNKYHPDETDPNKRVFNLQPLKEIHHDTRYGNYGQRTTSKTTLWALGLIGVFLLITACINFINLATAQAINRAREVGVRKVLGAHRPQLVTQYLGETFIITALGTLLATVGVELLLPVVNSLLNLKLQLKPFSDFSLLGFVTLLLLTVSLLAGLYPAFVLSRFVPAQALKSQLNVANRGRFSLRRGLVVFQFVISQMLIIGTLIVTQQMDYFRSKEMGFDQTAIVTTPLPVNDAEKLRSLRILLLQNSGIGNVSFSWSSASSGNRWDTNLRHRLNGPEATLATDLKFADNAYIATNDLKLIAGRNYVDSDTVSEFVVNETFARKLGLVPHDLVGKTFKLGGRTYLPVVGVVRDFHTTSLHDEIRPCLLAARQRSYEEASIKIATANMQEAMAHIEMSWSAVFPEFVYSYEFLDERIASFYEEEQKMAQLFLVFSGIAIFIGCIGLLGLVSFMVAQRTKEIGVRKVLGATVADILALLSREFALLIVIAFIVAAPIAYVSMQHWLENFAYRVDVGYSVFAATIAATLLIVGLTVGFRALKAALANPAESLRYE
ncbi:MAG TPA: ABC transporter permease [bacterium]